MTPVSPDAYEPSVRRTEPITNRSAYQPFGAPTPLSVWANVCWQNRIRRQATSDNVNAAIVIHIRPSVVLYPVDVDDVGAA